MLQPHPIFIGYLRKNRKALGSKHPQNSWQKFTHPVDATPDHVTMRIRLAQSMDEQSMLTSVASLCPPSRPRSDIMDQRPSWLRELVQLSLESNVQSSVRGSATMYESKQNTENSDG